MSRRASSKGVYECELSKRDQAEAKRLAELLQTPDGTGSRCAGWGGFPWPASGCWPVVDLARIHCELWHSGTAS